MRYVTVKKLNEYSVSMVDSKQEIMEATNEALRKHSYSELSIQNIADEFEKSKSLLYHHYDGKDEILLEFMDFMLENFSEEVLSEEKESPEDALKRDAFMAFDSNHDCGILKTLTELRTQGLRDERFQEKFHGLEKTYKERLEDLIRAGKESNRFRESVDPEISAEFILAVNHEALHQKAAGREIVSLEKELENYIESQIYRD